ncbi:8710_t:CDS:2 [Cetraspora pellucida]|uniref:8710_t:CDS:1 n=1 Tax=Cetraspora pellucida TaxID=1433469 RepID=A0ACA9LYK2_9GLOM|nr:8710_t:CDS:2 [Cetraspora pellucida]
MPPPRRQHLGGEVVNHVKEIHKTTLLGLIYRQDSKRAENLLFKVDSHKEDSCRELDKLIDELSRAEEKYLPLTEYGYPVKKVFDRSRQSIFQLRENFMKFTQRQLSLTQTILNEKVLAEKEKVKATIENLRIEVANLKRELIKNNDQIVLLNERHKKLLSTYKSLLMNHDILNEDYVALLENNSNYYVERCRLLEQENSVLVKRNLELFEEIGELRKEIGILYEEINQLKKRNESLSCIFTFCISLMLEESRRAFQSDYGEENTFYLFGVIAVKKGSAEILREIEVYMGSPELNTPNYFSFQFRDTLETTEFILNPACYAKSKSNNFVIHSSLILINDAGKALVCF